MNFSRALDPAAVATTLIAIGVLLVGVVAYVRLPIAAMPSVDRPTIGAMGRLAGRERGHHRVRRSRSRWNGRSAPSPASSRCARSARPAAPNSPCSLQLDKSIDAAAGAIQAAINAAGPSLPKDLPQPPVYWKANPSGWAVIALSLTSDVLDPSDVYDIADTIVAEQISQVPGVAQSLRQRCRTRCGAHSRRSGRVSPQCMSRSNRSVRRWAMRR